MSAFGVGADTIKCAGGAGNKRQLSAIDLEETEEILSWDVSDEALEIAGTAGQEIAGAYTLQFCTSMDCALAS